jgi:hypothetical protein
MTKLRRNDPCVCGSGKKYKQCCLQHEEQSYRRKTEDPAQEFLEQDHSHQFVHSEEIGSYKMSEVLLEYGSDLLETADTGEKKEEAVCLCILAWNLSWLSENQRSGVMDALLIKKQSPQEDALRKILTELVIRRQVEYPFYNRFIYNFSLQDGENEMYFSVLSREVPLLTEEGKESLSTFCH